MKATWLFRLVMTWGQPALFWRSSYRLVITCGLDAADGSDPEHHVLDDRVVLDRVHRLVLAVARLLEATVGHLGGEREVVVDPDRAELDRLGHPHRPADVRGPYRGRQPEPDVVAAVDRLVLVREALD